MSLGTRVWVVLEVHGGQLHRFELALEVLAQLLARDLQLGLEVLHEQFLDPAGTGRARRRELSDQFLHDEFAQRPMSLLSVLQLDVIEENLKLLGSEVLQFLRVEGLERAGTAEQFEEHDAEGEEVGAALVEGGESLAAVDGVEHRGRDVKLVVVSDILDLILEEGKSVAEAVDEYVGAEGLVEVDKLWAQVAMGGAGGVEIVEGGEHIVDDAHLFNR